MKIIAGVVSNRRFKTRTRQGSGNDFGPKSPRRSQRTPEFPGFANLTRSSTMARVYKPPSQPLQRLPSSPVLSDRTTKRNAHKLARRTSVFAFFSSRHTAKKETSANGEKKGFPFPFFFFHFDVCFSFIYAVTSKEAGRGGTTTMTRNE